MARLFIRINMAREAKWLESVTPQDYGGVVVSSHIVENIPYRVAKMLARLKKPYLIDPYTYVFGGDVANIREKPWFASLLDKYGLDMIVDRDTLSLRPDMLVDSDGNPTGSLQELVDNVVAYQRDAANYAADDVEEFVKFESGDAAAPLSPYGIMPPYFFIDGKSSSWLDANMGAVRLAIEQKRRGDKVVVPIMIDRSVMLDRTEAARIVNAYDIDGVDEFMVWAVQMDEKSADRGTLECFRDLVTDLARRGRPVTSMYGGLFTLLVQGSADATLGTTHSVCYGEHRTPFVVGAPAATVMFYQGQVRTKIPLSAKDDVESALDLSRCECQYCRGMQQGMSPAPLFELAGKHFLARRMEEVGRINTGGAARFLREMAAGYEHAKSRDVVRAYGAYYRDFGAWNDVLGDPKRGDGAAPPPP